MAPMHTTHFWDIYKLFHEPPGTPAELKCVKCKLATGGLFSGLAGLSAIGAKMRAPISVFQMMSCIAAGTGFMVAGLLTFRTAYDNHHFNEKLIADRAQDVSTQRKENRLKQKQQQQQA